MAKKVAKRSTAKKTTARKSAPARRSASAAPRRSSAKRVVISPVTLLVAGAVLAMILLWAYSSLSKSDVSDPQAEYQSSESIDLE